MWFESVLAGGAGAVITMLGTSLMGRRATRHRIANELNQTWVPRLDKAVRSALENPIDRDILVEARDLADTTLRVALPLGGWSYAMATQVFVDLLDYERSISLTAAGRTIYAGQAGPFAAEVAAVKERWHLEQAEECMQELESEVLHLIAPSRRPRKVIARQRLRWERFMTAWRWRRNFRRDQRARKRQPTEAAEIHQ